jgi:hypothetical protein
VQVILSKYEYNILVHGYYRQRKKKLKRNNLTLLNFDVVNDTYINLHLISVGLPDVVSSLRLDTKKGFTEFVNKFVIWRQVEPGAMKNNSVLGSFLIMDGANIITGNFQPFLKKQTYDLVNDHFIIQ